MEYIELITIKKRKLRPNKRLDLKLLKDFITSNPIGRKTFRYFEFRKFSIIQNHLYTCLYFKNNDIIGYGHLDFENGKIWLGIVVGDNHHSKGYGSFIMDDLICQTNYSIFLTVDKENHNAIKLYKNKNFEIIEEHNKHYLMIKKNG